MKKKHALLVLGNALIFIGLISAILLDQGAPVGAAVVGIVVIGLQLWGNPPTKKATLVSLLILAGVSIVFLAGYQLAVYQSNNGDNFSLPHFNSGCGTSQTYCASTNCGTNLSGGCCSLYAGPGTLCPD